MNIFVDDFGSARLKLSWNSGFMTRSLTRATRTTSRFIYQVCLILIWDDVFEVFGWRWGSFDLFNIIWLLYRSLGLSFSRLSHMSSYILMHRHHLFSVTRAQQVAFVYHVWGTLVNFFYLGAFVGEDVVSPHHPEETGFIRRRVIVYGNDQR